MIKLIAIDMDGTLLDSKGDIPTDNIQAIQAAVAAGVKIVLCTGRPRSGIIPYFEQLGLLDNEFVIANNGCATYQTKDWTLYDYRQLTLEQIDRLDVCASLSDEISLVLMTPDQMYVLASSLTAVVQADAEVSFSQPRLISKEELPQIAEPIFLGLFMGRPQAVDFLQGQIEEELSADFHTVRGLDYVFEALPQATNKATSLERLATKLGLVASQVMAIGDAANDLEMLTFAGLAVAMGNADKAVKDLADYQTVSNDEAGVAQAIWAHL